MIWYKAWLESRTRLLLSAITLVVLCISLVVFHREGASALDQSNNTFTEYIWRIIYNGYLRELFVILAVLLGVGGLLREKDYGTSGFTLALPVSRWNLILVRAATGLLQVGVLSLIPAIIIPVVSHLIGQPYPWAQAIQFSLLWAAGGSFLFSLGFLASTLFEGEYTAPVLAVIGVVGYSAAVDLPFIKEYVPDIDDVMSGAGMAYFQPDTYSLVGPLPWSTLATILLMSATLILLAGLFTQAQEF